MNELLYSWAQAKEMPLVAAFALGLLTAIAPCPLATNITATAYIAKTIKNKNIVVLSGLLYTLGRMFSYTLIGWVITAVIVPFIGVMGLVRNEGSRDRYYANLGKSGAFAINFLIFINTYWNLIKISSSFSNPMLSEWILSDFLSSKSFTRNLVFSVLSTKIER